MSGDTGITHVKALLKAQFAELVDEAAAEDALKIAFPGGSYPTLVFVSRTGAGSVIRVVCPVTDWADWDNAGLAEFLLREGGTKVFGRVERVEDGVSIEHALFPDISADQLAKVVRALAHTAIRLERDLCLMGALTRPDEIEE